MGLPKGSSPAILTFIFAIMVFVIGSFVLFETSIQTWILTSSQNLTQSTAPAGPFIAVMFVISLLTFDILLPIPSSIVSAFAANHLALELSTLSIWCGLTLGSCLGYWIGQSSGDRLLNKKLSAADRQRVAKLANKMGFGTLVFMRGVPVLAETSVIAAGMMHYPWRRFLVATSLANLGLALAYGYFGKAADIETPFLAIVAGSVAIPTLAWLAKILWQRFIRLSAINNPRNVAANHHAHHAATNALAESAIQAEFSMRFSYPVQFTEHAFATSNQHLKQLLQSIAQQSEQIKVMVIVDSGITTHNSAFTQSVADYLQQSPISLLTAPVILPGGEAVKDESQINQLYQTFWHHNVDRHAIVIAIGGGALLDAVGYACATFHRGVKLLRMPSTVLAQNDAGVGIKNGYNRLNAKNLIGTFAPPHGVLNDFALLNSLSTRDQRAGLAEAVKVAAIRSEAFFNWLEDNAHLLAQFDAKASQYAIKECARLHLKQITGAGDPFETGSARPLDYGHWSAHKLESLTQYQVRHGEAVAIGMALDALYATATGLLATEDSERVLQLLQNLGFELWHPALLFRNEDNQNAILQGVEEFRQHLGGELCITLLHNIGTGKEVNSLDLARLQSAIEQLQQRFAPPADLAGEHHQ